MPADTIFALSSGQLPAGVAVMRISGSEALAVASSLVNRLPDPHEAALRTLSGTHFAFLAWAMGLVFSLSNSFAAAGCLARLDRRRAVNERMLYDVWI